VTLALDPDWHAFLCALIDHRVRFLVVGSVALAAHAEPRFTKDLDRWSGKRSRMAAGCTRLLISGFGDVSRSARARKIGT
jgi:hypothetical protein